MTTKHTPGPWKVEKELTSRPGEWLIAMDAGDRGRGIAIAETVPATGKELANARLIAAAPELLEALDELVACKALKDRIAAHQQLLVHETDEEFQEMDCVMTDYARRQPAAWEKARAAIAKALGEQQ